MLFDVLEPAMQFFVGVLHRRKTQRLMFLLHLCHELTTKNSSKRSDLQNRSRPALGVERCRQERPEDTSLCSPLFLLEAAGLDWRGPLPVFLVRSRHLEAAFRSPVTTVRFRAAIAGSPFPTCFFNTSLDRLQVRSARDSSLRRFAPASAISTPPARCPDFNPSIQVSPRTRSP